MGGRGARSGGIKKLHASGNGGSGGSNFSNGLGFQNYRTGAEALGRQGKPMNIADAVNNANPHYDKTGMYSEFNENCQRCVVAYEARRRGYDVTAQPTYRGDTMSIDENWNKAFENPQPATVTSRAQVEVTMASYGSGARAVLSFDWKDGRSGHVINVEYNRGHITYLDPQVGGKYVGSELFSAISTTSNMKLTRVDNLNFSDGVKNAVTKDKW